MIRREAPESYQVTREGVPFTSRWDTHLRSNASDELSKVAAARALLARWEEELAGLDTRSRRAVSERARLSSLVTALRRDLTQFTRWSVTWLEPLRGSRLIVGVDPAKVPVSIDPPQIPVRFQDVLGGFSGTGGRGKTPVEFGPRDRRAYWLFQDTVYSTEEVLEAEDVRALVLEEVNKKKLRLQRARFLLEATEALEDNKTPRVQIPDDVKVFVWQRDGGKCAQCGSNRNLEFDHVIPLAMGGSNTARNLQLLCETHNREKGGRLV